MHELEKVSGIGKATAERMTSAGIDTIEKLSQASLDDLLKVKGIGEATAEKYIKRAKALVEETKKPKEKKPKAEKKEAKKKKKEKPKKEKKKKKKKEKEKPVSKKQKQKQKKKKSKEKKSIKKLIKKQAECNIGLVGHVDHGKTTLVKALTGDWTDRHSREQERGISIKLGYSNATILYCPSCDEYLTLHLCESARKKGEPRYKCPDCKGDVEFKRNISFVDAPGHEILMATMLSGASLMDGACLLIAANEKCPQPQTREHLAALDIAGIERIIIIQNKIDSVSKERALENYEEIEEFVRGTVAENAPIIPTSAVFGVNTKLVLRGFEEIIPTPEMDETDRFQFLVARSFDINKPGTDIENLHGGVIGGSVLQGKVSIGDKIEIRPGLNIDNQWNSITTEVVSISQGRNFLNSARPGGLIGLGTKLDPTLTKGDSLIGDLVGLENDLPEVLDEVELEVNLLDRVIGSENLIKVHELKHNEKLLMVVGTQKTAGVVKTIYKDTYVIKLNPPICPPENFIFAISRIINRRYRLIGYGKQVTKNT